MTQYRFDRAGRISRNHRHRRLWSLGSFEHLERRDLPSTVITSFTTRFSRNDTGDIAIIGNTLMTAPATAAGDAARNGTGGSLNNNDFNMVRVDVDGDATTINSSRATLAMPSGAKVLFAGLYWGAESGNAARNQVKFRTPSTGAYVNLTGSIIGVTGNDYEGFADVTTLVQLGGNGVYTVGNVQSNAGSADLHAGWGLVVVYRDPAAPPRNLTVFDGFAVVNTAAPSTISTTISGFTTPLVGPVNAKVGFIAYEGDLGLTGDFCRLNGVNLTDATNPTTNFFNSSVSTLGVGNPGRTPSYVNQMGFDADIVQANGIVPNAATSATVTLGTGGETYYPGVITTAIDIYAPVFVSPKTVVDLNGGNIEPGDILEYTVTVQNTGGDNANESVLTDPIPTYTSYVPGTLQIVSGANPGPKTDASGDDQAEFDVANNRVVFRIGAGATGGAGGSMTVGSTTQVTFRVQVSASVPNNTPIINQATATGKGATAGLVVSAASAAATSVVSNPGAGLKLGKSVSNARPNVGDTITYTLTLVNQGPNSANGIVVRDQLPSGLNFINAVGTGSYDSGTGDWNVGTLVNGATATLTITATVTAPNASLNTASIISSSAPDPDPSDNTASAPVTPRRADLGLVKSVSNATPNVGDVITYRLALSNYGPDPATGINVTDLLPAGVTFVSASTLSGAFDAGTGIWNVGNLSETGVAFLTINALVTSPAPATNSAAITSSAQYDPTPGNNTSSAVVQPQLADVSLLKTVDNATPVANETITFTLTVSNTGPATATNVHVSDLLPAGMVFVSATPTQGTFDSATNLWTVGSLAPSVSRTLTLRARVIAPAPSMNRASVSADQYDPDPGDNTVAVNVVPQTADIDVDKRVNNSGPNVGESIAYSVRVRNRGPNAATNVYVDDLLPAGVAFSQAIASQGSYDSVTGRWTVGALAVGDEASLTIIVTVVSPSAIVNTATGGSDQFDPAPNNNVAQSIITAPQSDLSVVKNVDVAAPNLDSLVTYTVTLNNIGPDTATAPTVYDPLPAGLEFVSASASVGTYDVDNGVWSLPNLASGQSATLTLVARVIGPGSATNIARATAAEFDPDATNNTATTPITPNTILSGSVYEDLNNDGLRGVSEPGIAGVTIQLRDNGTNALVATTTTNAEGLYSFVSVPVGTYRLVEIQPANYTDGLDAAGTAGGTVGNDTISAIPVTAGRRLTGYTFGEVATPPTITIGNASATEGGHEVFAITLSNSVGTPIVLNLSPAGGTAIAGSDYSTSNFEYSVDGGLSWLAGSGIGGTQVTVPPGSMSILARIATLQDSIDEPNETFNLSATAVSGAVASITPGVGTIVDDDPAPSITIGSAMALEGNSLSFAVVLSNTSASAIVLDLTASGGNATAGADYSAVNFEYSTDGGSNWLAGGGPNGRHVTVPAGNNGILFRIASLQDIIDEQDETFNVSGVAFSGAVTSISVGTGTILDDDPAPTVTIGNASATEASPLVFTLNMSNPSSGAIVLDLSSSGGTAAAGIDYTPQNFEFSTDGGTTWTAAGGVNGTEVTMPAGVVSILARIASLADTTDELDETFNLSGTVVSGFAGPIISGVGTIVDDDPAPTVTIGNASATEGQPVVFSLSLSNPSASSIVLDLTASSGTAAANIDFTPQNFEYSTDGGATWQPAIGANGTEVIVPAGSVNVLVRVATVQDMVTEGDETFGLSGAAVSGSVAAINPGVGTIINDDAAPMVTIGSALASEGDPIVFAVVLSNQASTPITLALTASGGTATAGVDYSAQNFEYSIDGGATWLPAGGTNGTEVTIPANSNGILVRIATLQDATDEPDESFNLAGTPVSGPVGGVVNGLGTIVDDDAAPTVTIGNASSIEGNLIVFALNLSHPSAGGIVIDLAPSGGTATSGVDYTPTGFEFTIDGGATWLTAGGVNETEVTFPAGVTSIQVRLSTLPDVTDEPDETFDLSGTLLSGSVTTINPGFGTILDDDAAPVVTIGDGSNTEGSPVVFLVSLSNPSSTDIVLDLTASSGTATAGSDFDPLNVEYSTDGGATWLLGAGVNATLVTVPANASDILVRVSTLQDATDEANELFGLTAVATSGAVTGINPGVGMIVDDDPAPTVTIGNSSASEGSPVVFSLSLTNPSSTPIVLDLAALAGSASTGVDYSDVNFEFSTDGGATWLAGGGTNGTQVTIPAGSNGILVRVATLQDSTDEPNEDFILGGVLVSGAVSAINSGTGVIIDDDPAPTITISNGSATEGSPVAFTLSLSNPSSTDITIDLTSSGGSATSGGDYDATSFEFSIDGGVTWQSAGGVNGTEVTVPANSVSLSVRVTTLQDVTDEPAETFNLFGVVLSGTATAVVPGVGTIVDDDPAPTVTIGNASASEGNPLVFPISLSNPSSADITIDLSASGGTATAGGDFIAVNFEYSTDGGATWQPAAGVNGTEVVVPANSLGILARIATLQDTIDEVDENFILSGVAVSGTVTAINSGTGVIFDDDAPPTITIGSALAAEGNPLVFAVVLSNTSSSPIVLDLTASGGTATAGVDYTPANFEYSTDGGATWQSGGGVNGTEVTVPASSSGILVRVQSLQDVTDEPNETFTLSGAPVSGAVGFINSGLGTIVDDEPAPTITIGSGSATEGAPVVFSLSLSNPSSSAITIDLAAAGGTAVAGVDYTPINFEFSTDGGATWQLATGANGTEVTVPANALGILARVATLQDSTDEPGETFNLSGSVISGSASGVLPGVGTIVDDDPAPTVTIGNGSAAEGVPVVFPVNLSNPSSTAIVLDLTASSGTAAAGVDFATTSFEFSIDGGGTWTAAGGVNGTEVTIPANIVGILVRVGTIQDTTDEPDETFTLAGVAVSGNVTTIISGQGSILDDDAAPTVTIANGSATEGSPVVFPITLSNPSSNDIVLELTASGGTAATGTDYTDVGFEFSTNGGVTWQPATGTNGTQITFPAGVVALQVRVVTLQDATDELDETFDLTGTLVSGQVAAINTATGTIVDDDAAPIITIGNASALEGSPIVFPITVTNPASTDLVIDLATSDVTAVAGVDYTPNNFEYSIDGGGTWLPGGGPNGTEITIPAGTVGMLVRTTTIADPMDEPDETFILSAISISGAISGINSGTGTVLDDDAAPTVTIGSAVALEGSPLLFPVNLSNPSSSAIVIELAASGGTALAGSDYAAQNFEYSTDGGATWLPAGGVNGVEVTVPAGQLSILVRVQTLQDVIDEPNETFNLSGVAISGGVTVINPGVGTIADDDQPAVVTIASPTAIEGDLMVFPVLLSNPSSLPIVIELTPTDVTATAGLDYIPVNIEYSTDGGATWQQAFGPNGTQVTISAGDTSVLVRIDTLSDNIDEANETFDLSGTLVSGTVTAINPGVGTIIDNDPAPTVTIGNASATEGSLIAFTVNLSNPSAASVVLDLVAAGGTATAGTDYDVQSFEYSIDGGATWQPAAGSNATEVTFAAGETSMLVRLATLQDTIDEPSETFNLSANVLSGTVTAVNAGVGSIVDDDPAPTVTIGSSSATEGNSIVFPVSLSNPSSSPIVINLLAAGGTATAGTDYSSINLEFSTDGGATWQPGGGVNGTQMTVPANAANLLVRVVTLQDTTDEPDESFNLSGTPISGAVSAILPGVGTIVDDDPAPTVTIGSASATEGAAITFAISLNNPSSTPIVLDLAASGGDAIAGLDYTAQNFQYSTDGGATWLPGSGVNGTQVTIPANSVGVLVRVDSLSDIIDELNETFNLSGVVVSGLASAVNPGVGTIIDDDPAPTVTIGNASATEGSPVVFPISLSNPSYAPIVIDFTASSGSAIAGIDFVAQNFEYSTDGGTTWQQASGANGTEVTVPAGSVALLVRVTTLQDSIDELNESFSLSGALVSGAVTTINSGVGTIVDDDPAPTVTIASASAIEGNPIAFPVSLSNPSYAPIVLDFNTLSGTATSIVDFAPQSFEYSLDGGATWLPGAGVNGTQVAIPAGAVSLLVRVATVADNIDEADESFTLSAAAAGGTVSGINAAVGTILDDDAPPTITIGDASALEGAPIAFPISLSNPSSTPIEIELTAASGSAVANVDFLDFFFEYSTDGGATWQPGGGVNSTEVTIPAGSVSILVRVVTLSDNIDELDEDFVLSGTAISGAVTSIGNGLGTIIDDDPAPTITISNASAVEGLPIEFPVSLSNPSWAPITLDFATSDGTAMAPFDYMAQNFEYSLDGGVTWLPAGGPNGTEVTIPSGVVNAIVRVNSQTDVIDELDETLTLSATPTGGAVTAINPGIGTIVDDDPAPTISIGDASAVEGNPAVFSVSLSNPSWAPITLDFTAGGGTASPGSDFDPNNFEYSLDGGVTWLQAGGANGTEVTIPAGVVSLLVRVATLYDTQSEADESFTLTASPLFGSISGVMPGQGTVIDTPPIQFSGYVWEDDNNDGVFDLGEAPIGGVTVTLTGFDDLGNSINFTAVTDGAGLYQFVNIRPSDAAGYTLTETQPAAYLDGQESLGTQGGMASNDVFTGIFMAPGASGDNYNFGELRPASLGGFVYIDADDDGVFDLGELPAGGVSVRITGIDDLGAFVDQTVNTAGDGSYSFGWLRPGDYMLTEVGQPAGTFNGKSTSGTPFGGVNAVNAIGNIAVFAGGTGQNYNFGDLPPSSVSGVVFFDLNNDGVQDVGEVGIGGVPVTLTGVDIQGNNINVVVNTAADGSYLFAGLLAGDYTITESQPSQYADGQDRAGNFNGSVSNDVISLTLPLGSTATGYTFGEVGRSIAGTVYLDRNRDNVQQGSEPGLGGLTITLRDSGNNVVATTVTAADGSYLFTQQLLQDYTVTTELAVGYLPVTPLTQSVSLTVVGISDLDFAQTLGTLHGSVYRDYNLDGLRQAGSGETGVAGVTITLTGTDANGATINRTTTTAADGSFVFIDLLQGTYTLHETQPPSPPAPNGLYDGFNAFGSSGGVVGPQGSNQITNINLAAGTDGVNYLFGEIPTADPFGFVYLDVNNNGVREAGEPGIPNVQITISGTAFFGTALARPLVGGDLPGGSLTVLTDANGRYEFNPMPPGLYSISEKQPNGYGDGKEQNGDSNPPFTVVVGNDVFSNIHLAPNPIRGPFNFGELSSGMLAGSVFLDLNANGVQDASESGVAGVTIRLTGNDLLGNTINRSYVTGTSGSYAFVGVLPGTYTLTEVQPTGMNDGPDFIGTLGGLVTNDRFTNIVVGPGGIGRGYNFTEQPPTGLASKEELLANTQATGAVINGLNTANLRTSPNFTNSTSAIGLSTSTTPRLFAIGAGASGGPHVRVFDSNNGVERFSFFAYSPSFTGGVRVAVGDVNGDGTPDIITAPGAGGGPHIKVFSGVNGSLLSEFYAYGPSFSGGVYVAAGDVNNDGRVEIITGAGEGGGPHVRVFNGMNGHVLFEQYAFVPTFAGGVRVAAGDLNADGKADVIVAAGPGGGPHVRAFNAATATQLYEFYAYPATFRGGVFVSAGDVNGDGSADIVTSPGAGGGPLVRVLNGKNLAELASYFTYNPLLTSGVTVAARDFDGDGKAEIFCGPASNAASYIRVMNATTGDDIDAFLGFNIGFRGGVFVG